MSDIQTDITGKCRFCSHSLVYAFPGASNFDETNDLKNNSLGYRPLLICPDCFLVQYHESGLIDKNEQYYLSSFSSSRLSELQKYTDHIFKRFEVGELQLVAELIDHPIQSSDGKTRTNNVRFSKNNLYNLIEIYGKADLLICNHAFPYCANINEFISAIKLFLKEEGSISIDFFHILPWMESDEIYEDDLQPFSYFSFTTIDKILNRHGLVCYDVTECSTPSCLKITAKHIENKKINISSNVTSLRGLERDRGLSLLSTYQEYRNVQNEGNLKNKNKREKIEVS